MGFGIPRQGGDTTTRHLAVRGHVAPARQELSDAGGVVEVGVTVEQVHHGVLLLASLVVLRQVDDVPRVPQRRL